MKRLTLKLLVLVAVLGFGFAAVAKPKPAAGGGGGKVQSKFYDFSDQLIDGEIKKPTALYTDARQRVNFDRLLRLKKSFLPAMMQTSKERIFK